MKRCAKYLLLVLLFKVISAAAQTTTPLSEISGKWTNDIQFSGQSQFHKSENFFWVGKLWGFIEPTGRFRFASQNGCNFEGLAYPAYSWYEGQASVTDCSNPAMNRIYSVQLRKSGTFLSLSATTTTLGIGRVEAAYAFKGTLSRY